MPNSQSNCIIQLVGSWGDVTYFNADNSSVVLVVTDTQKQHSDFSEFISISVTYLWWSLLWLPAPLPELMMSKGKKMKIQTTGGPFITLSAFRSLYSLAWKKGYNSPTYAKSYSENLIYMLYPHYIFIKTLENRL